MRTKYLLSIIFSFISILSSNAQFSAGGGLTPPYSYEGSLDGTGIKDLFFYNSFSGASLSYTTDAINVEFYKYTRTISDKQQILDADISMITNGNNTTYTIHNLTDSRGYFIEINGVPKDVTWVIDYTKHEPILNSIEPLESGDKCEYLKLLVNKSDDLYFYAAGGGVHKINRLYQLEYNTLEWDKDNKEFVEKNIVGDPVNVGTDIDIPAPLLDTEFKLKGDQVARQFNIEKSIVSKPYTSVAVEAHMIAEQASTEDETGSSSLGGSAPVDINFYGYGNEPTTRFYTWYIYKKTDLENAIQRYTDQDIKYTFKESGDYLIQLDVIDRSSTCTATATQEFNITDFEWDVPNFMIVDGEHEFKVSYKSIIKFKCTIFNRWNQKIYEWTDPSKGWDGKYKGKYVNTGVYFYVMTAVSGDGKTHKKAGDLNVVRKR